MNRLQTELHRLYLVDTGADTMSADSSPALISASGRVRALVLELARPPSWEVLSTVWQGVQTELGLPAPAIAVSGLDALQLWFSLAEPVETLRAHAFLEGLRLRFLADLESSRVRLLPAANGSALGLQVHARLVPARQENTGNWSAFLAPDLVAVFADTPWLDIPPNEEGQAALLQNIDRMEPAAFEAAFRSLVPIARPLPSDGTSAGTSSAAHAHGSPPCGHAGGDPEQFLLRVMHDDAAPLALRVDAAKTLLQYANNFRTPHRD